MSEYNVQFTAESEDVVPFAQKFLTSQTFHALFREGMGLVEDVAAYLDGEGREHARSLTRMAALSYAAESMRLTTRLMQSASWLLVQRAVSEGEITSEQALTEKNRVRLTQMETTLAKETFEALPQELKDFIAHSLRLQERIKTLDLLMQGKPEETPALVSNPIAGQMDLLRSAFSLPS
jgi:regulator of CtrA degradation